MKEITQDNIALIRAICNKNGITFYDVQLEAIDHIASMVEHRWELFPNEDFITALDAIIPHVDWRPFRYKNYSQIHGITEWEVGIRKNKILFTFIMSFIILILTIVYTNWGKEVYNETFLNIMNAFKFIILFYYIISSIWISKKLYKAKFMLSYLYKNKYWYGIVICISQIALLLFNILITQDFSYNQSVQGIILNSFTWIVFAVFLYYKILKVIIYAGKNFPTLYSSK